MKTLLIMAAALLTMNAYSANFTATVEKSMCGEIDPFAIGDACLLYLEKDNGKKLALLMDFDEFQDEFSENELRGQQVKVYADTLENIKGEALAELRSMDSSYYYQAAEMSSIKVVKNSEMDRLIRKIGSSYFYLGNLPEGYSGKAIKKADFKFKSRFKKWLKETKKEKIAQWKEYVIESGEYDHLSKEELERAMNNIEEFMGVEHLLVVEDIYALYRGTKFIGYYIQVNDYVQADIYQDGAWYELFLDTKQKVIREVEESA